MTLAHAYRTGDLSFAYPLMRGTAPLLVALLGIVFLRELPTRAGRARHPADLRRHRQHRVRAPRSRIRRPPPSFALANAAIIAVYTLVDGAGARASGNAASYVAWLTFLEAIPFLLWIRARRGRERVCLHRPQLAARAASAARQPRRLRASCSGR